MGKAKADEMEIWTKDEFQQFADCLMDKRISWLAFQILFWTGIRIGELLALTFGDVDLDGKVITISKSYQRLKGKDVITPPKTPKSNRRVNIPQFLADDIRDYRGSGDPGSKDFSGKGDAARNEAQRNEENSYPFAPSQPYQPSD